jgi:Tfp pilus assembly protein PilF
LPPVFSQGRFLESVRMSNLVRDTMRVLLCSGFSGLLLVSAGCQATNGWAFNNSGKGYYARGNYAMARDEFHRAVIDDSCNPDYRHNLAMAMKRTGDVAGAERVLRANLENVSAMHQPTYHSLSQLLAEQNRHAEAQDLLQGWAVAQPYIPESHVELAWIQRESGNLPRHCR